MTDPEFAHRTRTNDARAVDDTMQCPSCEGERIVPAVDRYNRPTTKDCDYCHGTGTVSGHLWDWYVDRRAELRDRFVQEVLEDEAMERDARLGWPA